jgi:hypothetical protein
MTIQEVIDLHRAKAISSVKIEKRFNHRRMVEISVTATIRALTPQADIVLVPFKLDHHALKSDLWTMRLLDDNAIPFEFSDLTETAVKRRNGRSPRAPKPSRSSSNCVLCGKTCLDLSTGCYNPSTFSPAVGDWVCNVNLELSQGATA